MLFDKYIVIIERFRFSPIILYSHNLRFDDESSELNHFQFGRCVIYLYLMGESSSRVLEL